MATYCRSTVLLLARERVGFVATSFGLEPPRAGEEPPAFAADAFDAGARFDPTCLPAAFDTTAASNNGLQPNPPSGLLSKSEASALSSHHIGYRARKSFGSFRVGSSATPSLGRADHQGRNRVRADDCPGQAFA